MPEEVWKEYIEPKTMLFDQVENLPYDQKLVLALHYYEGLSFAEIGMLMNIAEWQAAALHAQALVVLQSRIQDLFGTEE
jgi:DNA-directed RNA polymerase specialized sigma subunit